MILHSLIFFPFIHHAFIFNYSVFIKKVIHVFVLFHYFFLWFPHTVIYCSKFITGLMLLRNLVRTYHLRRTIRSLSHILRRWPFMILTLWSTSLMFLKNLNTLLLFTWRHLPFWNMILILSKINIHKFSFFYFLHWA